MSPVLAGRLSQYAERAPNIESFRALWLEQIRGIVDYDSVAVATRMPLGHACSADLSMSATNDLPELVLRLPGAELCLIRWSAASVFTEDDVSRLRTMLPIIAELEATLFTAQRG